MGLWKPVNLAQAASVLPALEQQLSYLQQQLIAAASGPVDHIYSRIGLVNGTFFPRGWGNLGVVNLAEDLKLMQSWPPPGLKIDWKRIDQGVKDGIPFKLYEGKFKTPCVSRVYDALPPESRTGRVQLLVPDNARHSLSSRNTANRLPTEKAVSSGKLKQSEAVPASLQDLQTRPRDAPLSAAVHLAATGDQGFGRRLRLSFPLLRQGVCAVIHESPFYGARRPAAQKGSKLVQVSDLMALGWATIFESVNLLHWLSQEGFDEGGLGMAGLSMGGVHACMTAALYPHDIACTALLAPRSAAVAYCDGALSAAMAWEPLLAESDAANNDVYKVINTAAQAVSVMRQATHALLELELAWEAANSSAAIRTTPATITADAGACAAHNTISHAQGMAVQSHHQPHSVHEPSKHSHPHHHQHQHEQTALGSTHRHTKDIFGAGHIHLAGSPGPGLLPVVPNIDSSGIHRTSSGGMDKKLTAAEASVLQRKLEALAARREDLKSFYNSLVKGISELKSLSVADSSMERQRTLRRLKHVLETYTDITRFPVPKRPDAAVFVAATHDAYVTTESVRQLAEYWQGSDLRLVSGGHVTAFLMHQDKFRTAIHDSLKRLKSTKPQ